MVLRKTRNTGGSGRFQSVIKYVLVLFTGRLAKR